MLCLILVHICRGVDTQQYVFHINVACPMKQYSLLSSLLSFPSSTKIKGNLNNSALFPSSD